MANTLGLTKKLEKAGEQIKEKLAEKKHEATEKINPLSKTNKEARRERHAEFLEQKKAEREAMHKERIHQAEERGKHKVQREYGTYKTPRSRGGGGTRKRGIPVGGIVIQPAVDPFFGMLGPSRTKPVRPPTKTTTVRTGDKTITIREKVSPEQQEQQKKKRQAQYDFPDPLDPRNFGL